MKILVVAAHPDDEILGCGATLYEHSKSGHETCSLILSTGLTSREAEASESSLVELQEQGRKANLLLGVKHVEYKKFPDNRMDTVARLEITQTIEEFLKNFPAEIIYTHHPSDLNVDHKACYQAVSTATRPLANSPVKRILCFETLSSTEWSSPLSSTPFRPNFFHKVSAAALEKKKQALACYLSEIRDWPHPRSLEGIESLAKFRGSNIENPYAEAFELHRAVEDLRNA